MGHLPSVSIGSKEIKQTNFFKQLSPIMKELSLYKCNREAIAHGVNVASNIGYEKWEAQTGTRTTNKMIVKEILQEQTSLVNG